MKDPVRWLEDSAVPQSVRRVIAAADPVPKMPETVHAHLAAHCAVLAAQCGAAHAVAGGTWTKLVAWSMASNAVKGVAFATLVSAAGTAGYYVFREPVNGTSYLASGQQQAHAKAPAKPFASSTGSARSPIDESAAELRVPATSSNAPRLSAPHKTKGTDTLEQSTSSAAAPRSTATTSVAAFDDPTIAEEAALLERARAVLETTPAQALALVQQHEHLHPSGQLYAEREFIAVAALLRLGRRQEAWQRAEPRLQQAPDSLYSKRLRSLFGR
jgi:hypothetical protein